MIETEQTVTVRCGIEDTWAYARDFERWAGIMPGYQGCEIEDADNSRWILKVGVGAMVRTVRVRVRVDEWAGPERVDFSFKLEGDPVVGRGAYLATPEGSGATGMTLRVQVEGSGPMAPMWEAMGAPLLPKFAKAFAEQLKARIEEFHGASAGSSAGTGQIASPSVSVRPRGGPLGWLRSFWQGLFGRKEQERVQGGSPFR